MYDDDTEVARNCKVFDDYLALSCILGAGLRTERLHDWFGYRGRPRGSGAVETRSGE